MVSLARLCLTSRPKEQCVALSTDSAVLWEHFTQDVLALTQVVKASPHQRWAMAFDDIYLFATAFFACAHAGKAIVLPGNLQQGALDALSTEFDAMLHDAHRNMQDSIACLRLPLASPALPHTHPIQALSELDLTLFTSGSSGAPKPVKKSLTQLQAELNELEQTWGELIAGTQIQSTVSHQHIYGLLFRVLWPLCAGRPFQRRDLVYPEQVVARAEYSQVLVSSPALLKRTLQKSNGHYRAIFSSGGPLPFSSAEQCSKYLGTLPHEVYGSTETGGIGFRQQSRPDTQWRLFNNIKARLNEESCLSILSPYIDPSIWYQTEDVCSLSEFGTFTLNGRADRIVKVEEKRVSLVEVEQKLCQNAWVKDAYTLLHEDTGRQSIAAVIVLSSEGEQALTQSSPAMFKRSLRQNLRNWLEPVAIPRVWRFVETIPQNTQGKRQVREIEALLSPP